MTLSGTVETWSERDLAEDAAWHTAVATDVTNNITVEAPWSGKEPVTRGTSPSGEDHPSARLQYKEAMMPKSSEQEREHKARQEAGRKGGETRKEELGHKGYQQMGEKGAEARKKEREDIGRSQPTKNG